MCTERPGSAIEACSSVVRVIKKAMSWCKKEDLTSQHVHKGIWKNGIVHSGVLTFT